MNCPSCGRANVIKRNTRIQAVVKSERFQISMRGLVCPKCGFTAVDGKDMPEYMRLVADAYRSRHDLLTSEEIRARRKSLGMSQARFADHLGVGLASVKRWEMGKVQDRSSDRLIRLLTEQSRTAVRRKTTIPKRTTVSGVWDSEEMRRTGTIRVLETLIRAATLTKKCLNSPLNY